MMKCLPDLALHGLSLAEDLEKLREKEMFQGGGVWAAAVANVMDLDSLCRAFDGCTAVFHSSSSVDPRGISGYSVSSVHPWQPNSELSARLNLM